MNRWYRAYVGTCADPKFGAIAICAGVDKCKVVALWHFILEQAASANKLGKFKLDANLACSALCVTVEEVKNIWAHMMEYDLVTGDEVLNWKKRQYITDGKDPTNAARQRRWRETHGKRLRNGQVTVRHTPETETETETERKKRKRLPVAEPPEFLDFWNSVPHREGANPRFPALKAYVAAMKRGADPQQINAAAKRWNAETGAITPFVKTAVAWLNGRYYEEYHEERQRS